MHCNICSNNKPQLEFVHILYIFSFFAKQNQTHTSPATEKVHFIGMFSLLFFKRDHAKTER